MVFPAWLNSCQAFVKDAVRKLLAVGRVIATPSKTHKGGHNRSPASILSSTGINSFYFNFSQHLEGLLMKNIGVALPDLEERQSWSSWSLRLPWFQIFPTRMLVSESYNVWYIHPMLFRHGVLIRSLWTPVHENWAKRQHGYDEMEGIALEVNPKEMFQGKLSEQRGKN